MPITIPQIKQAYITTSRAGIACCQMVAKWLDEGGDGKEFPHAYLAAALGVDRTRICQLESAGRVHAQLVTQVTDKKLLADLTERHLRAFVPLLKEPEKLEAAVGSLPCMPEEGRWTPKAFREAAANGKPDKESKGERQELDADPLSRAIQKAIDLADSMGETKAAGLLRRALEAIKPRENILI